MAQEVDDGRGREDPLRHHRRAGEGVDEGRLAGIELADDDEEEERGQTLGGVLDRGAVLGGDWEIGDGGEQARGAAEPGATAGGGGTGVVTLSHRERA